MPEYNWDDFDNQAAEYLNSSDYQGDAFNTSDGQSWGGHGDPSSPYNFQQPSSTQDSLWGNGTNYGFSLDPNVPTNQFMPEQHGQST